jgi:hypothetical protein
VRQSWGNTRGARGRRFPLAQFTNRRLPAWNVPHHSAGEGPSLSEVCRGLGSRNTEKLITVRPQRWSGTSRTTLPRIQGGLVFQAHRLLYHSTLGSRVIQKEKKDHSAGDERSISEVCKGVGSRNTEMLITGRTQRWAKLCSEAGIPKVD